MSVTIAREAELDLEDIAGFIAARNPERAISFIRELVASCHALADHPQRHPIAADYGRRLRRFPYRGYSIYYQVLEADAVVVVHILSDALDHGRIFEN
jgi:plasmid stabilization system protein ParE